jgi:hypothetical protein
MFILPCVGTAYNYDINAIDMVYDLACPDEAKCDVLPAAESLVELGGWMDVGWHCLCMTLWFLW